MTQAPPPLTPPTAPSLSPAAGTPEAPKRAVGLAIAALVLGICGIIPCLGLPLGLAGLILGIVAMAKKTTLVGLAVGGIVAGAVTIVLGQALIVAIMVPSLSHARGLAGRAMCAQNLHSLSIEIAMYSSANEDTYPPDLRALPHQELGEILKCPVADSGREIDYFYLAPTVSEPDDDLIIACDFRDNHRGKGRNVLQADGRVTWMKKAKFQAELALPVNAEFAAALRAAEGP